MPREIYSEPEKEVLLELENGPMIERELVRILRPVYTGKQIAGAILDLEKAKSIKEDKARGWKLTARGKKAIKEDFVLYVE